MKKYLLVLLGLLLPFSNVMAEAEKGDGYVTIMGSYYDDDKDRNVEDGFRGFRVGFGYAVHDNWNLEAAIARIDADGSQGFSAGQRHLTIGADLQFVIARQSRFSPYLFAGLAQINTKEGGNENNDFAWSTGLGARIDLSANNPASLQMEYRYRNDNAMGVDLSDQIMSFGLHYPFGRKAAPAPAPAPVDGDSDGDGVKDSMDQCPDTPAGVSVDSRGCALDSDGDGVADYMDECPNTVRGAAVDEKGCELDSDGDGVVDRLDECPGTRAGAQVDIKGCEIKEEIRLPGVNFETNSDRLLPGSESVLNDAAATLNRNPTIMVEVAGHTDSDGTAEYNEGLSARRAATVRDYLVGRGVSADRMTTRGYGESQPIADNTTREGKAQNRRVVLNVTAR